MTKQEKELIKKCKIITEKVIIELSKLNKRDKEILWNNLSDEVKTAMILSFYNKKIGN